MLVRLHLHQYREIVLQDAETAYSFSVFNYTQAILFWGVGVAHLLLIVSLMFSFVCLPSIRFLVSCIEVVCNYRSSFSLRFLNFTLCNK
jgi:hypothetical protein